ncbi:MAG: replication-associated recombination protein A, partial [Nitrososphaerota archaeon]|nr:replication-associated recombination protein A [Nitrososphaerota archaeon]
EAWVAQGYRPAAVEGHVYYEPSDRGHEATIAERLARLRTGGDEERGGADDQGDAGGRRRDETAPGGDGGHR